VRLIASRSLEGDDIETRTVLHLSADGLPSWTRGYYAALPRASKGRTIELLNYGEEMIRSGLPIQQACDGWCQTIGHP